jgi:hypothetical protein
MGSTLREPQTAMVYPHDGNVIKVYACSVDRVKFKKPYYCEDKLVFGLRRATDSNTTETSQYNLISYKKVGIPASDSILKNDTNIFAESVQKQRNP